MVPMLMVSVSHMAVHDNISGHSQLVLLKKEKVVIMLVLVMLLLILPSHHLWVETISVNQESTLGQLLVFIHTILYGMVRTVLAAVHVAHSYFTKTLPNPTTDDIEVRLCQLDDGNTPIEFIDLYIKFEDRLEALTKDKLQHDNNVTEELMKISATLNENLQQVERNVLSHVTMELQNMYDSLREDQQQLENRVTEGLQMTCDNLPKDLYTGPGEW